MRVIAGRFKGRQLFAPKDWDIRPTADRVREALFDILGSRVEGAVFLDLFAGTGAVAIEALSRGAAQATLVEKSRRAAGLIRENLKRCGLSARLIVSSVERAVLRLLHLEESFDLIFADPPYRTSLARDTLELLASGELLTPCGLVVVEHCASEELALPSGRLIRYRVQRYGETALSFYRLKGDKH